jgi:cytoskeleton protein RodZ
MISIGETLRRERLRRNLDLDHFARETKISARMLEAIETEQFDRLPGGVFAKSFVRQYARALSLDEDELVAEFERAMAPPTPETEGATASQRSAPKVDKVDIKVPRVESWQGVSDSTTRASLMPALGFLAVMLACSGIYALWQKSRSAAPAHPTPAAVTTQQPAQQQPQAPATTQPAVTPPPAETTPQPAATQPEAPPPAATTPSDSEPQPAQQPPAQDQPAPGTAPATTPAATDPKAPADNLGPQLPQPKAVAGATVHVELRSAVNNWLSVHADGKYVFSGVLRENESRTVEAAESLTVRVGNAGAMAITLNGKPLGPVGPKGQVRTIQLTSGGFKIVPPAAKPSTDGSPTAPAAAPLIFTPAPR